MNPIDHQLEEERMVRLMQEATRDINVPLEQLVSEGRRRGIRLRRRRRLISAAGIGVCTAIVLGGFTIARPTLAPTPSDQNVAASSPSGDLSKIRSSLAVPADEMASTLAALLPAGSITGLRTWASTDDSSAPGPGVMVDGSPLASIGSEGDSAFRAGSLVYDDGEGAAAVSVLISAPDAMNPGGAAEDVQALCASNPATCVDVPQGRVVTLEDISEVARGGAEGVTSTSAFLVTDDGFSVAATVYNAAAEKGTAPTRERPALSGEQLKVIVTDPVWLS